jgi:hypothetical protein
VYPQNHAPKSADNSGWFGLLWRSIKDGRVAVECQRLRQGPFDSEIAAYCRIIPPSIIRT